MREQMIKDKKRLAAVLWILVLAVGLLSLKAQAADEPSKEVPAQTTVTAPSNASTSVAPASQPAKAPVAQQPGIVVKVKQWVKQVKNQWDSWRAGTLTGTMIGQKAKPAAPQSSVPASAPTAPSAMIGQNLAAPASEPTNDQKNVALPAGTKAGAANAVTAPLPTGPIVTDLPKTQSGVPVFQITNVEAIPRLGIGKEAKVPASRYALDGKHGDFFQKMVPHQIDSPPLLSPKELLALKKIPMPPGLAQKVQTVFFKPKGRVSRDAFDKIVLNKTPEPELKLAKFTPLTKEEMRFLSGLLLYQRGEKCGVAIGLFHSLAKTPKYESEGNYYLAMCSKKLGMTTDFIDRARKVLELGDSHYAKKILSEVSPDVPYEFIEPFGKALLKASSNKQIMSFDSPAVAGNVYYILANYGAQSENFKIAQTYGKMVPEGHAKWPQAQFLLALGEYQTGSKKAALELQEKLVTKMDGDKEKAEFSGLVALNLARMYFQERKFKESREWYLKVYKDHPLWLQSLQEMGWSQLQGGDYEGAIGNMYSVQSPYFTSVYKPESYVIRTIGYLNLCQYGDAYRTLSILEKQYRPWLEKMSVYQKAAPDYISTVRKFLAVKSAAAEIDGLPSQVIREMVRHKDYLNLQMSLNRQVDEREIYGRLDKEVDKSLSRARWLVNNSRKRSEQLRTQLAGIKKNPQLEQNRLAWKSELDNELALLNGYFFEIDVMNEAKASLQGYKTEVLAGAESRIAKIKGRIVNVLDTRMKRMRAELERMIDNNELLRYEVFAGSGENIRYQVAGGEKGNRVPANVAPKSKTLQWDFDGEYWEDEIGHYRSSLKNNCPDSKTASL